MFQTCKLQFSVCEKLTPCLLELGLQKAVFPIIFQHKRFIAEAKEREPEVLFVGDSLMRNLALTDVSFPRVLVDIMVFVMSGTYQTLN